MDGAGAFLRKVDFQMKGFRGMGLRAVSKLYDEANLPATIRRSLNFMLLANVMGNVHLIICGGNTTAMIGLTTTLGANDMVFGILAAIPQAAALLQLPVSVLINRTHKRKKYMLTIGTLSRALWLLFGLIPYIIPMASPTLQLWTIVFLLGISACCGSVINVSWLPWLSDLAPIQIRGRWLSIRESVVAVANVIIGLLVAYILEALPADRRYAIIFLIGGAFGVLDMVCFAFCDDVYSAPPQKQSLFKAFGAVFQNKPFMRVVVMWTVWCFTANMCTVYLNPYSMNEMGLSFMQIMIFSTITSAVVMVFAMPGWGRMIDRFGCRNVMIVCCTVASLTPMFYLFASPGNIWPTLLHNGIGAMFWCGANLASYNTQLLYSPDETRPTHIAVFSCVTALLGTTAGSMTGGFLLETWNSADMFTGRIDRYQALCALSAVLRLSLTLMLVLRLKPDKPSSPRDLLEAMFAPVVSAFHRKKMS